MRGLAPLLFLLGAGAVLGFNHSHPHQVIPFPGLDLLFPQYQGNLAMQGELTVYLLAGAALLLALLEARNLKRDREE